MHREGQLQPLLYAWHRHQLQGNECVTRVDYVDLWNLTRGLCLPFAAVGALSLQSACSNFKCTPGSLGESFCSTVRALAKRGADAVQLLH